MTLADPYALNEDGTAVDPTAFQGALRADAAKLALVNKEPEDRRGILLGDDMPAFQALLQDAVKAERRRAERQSKAMSERTIDAQRASAPVPRDTVQLYKQLHASGLQYGPAFRLLRNVHTPDMDTTSHASQPTAA